MRKYEALRLSLFILVPLLSTTSLVYRLRDSWATSIDQQQQQANKHQYQRQHQHQRTQVKHGYSRIIIDNSVMKIVASDHHQSKVSFC